VKGKGNHLNENPVQLTGRAGVYDSNKRGGSEKGISQGDTNQRKKSKGWQSAYHDQTDEDWDCVAGNQVTEKLSCKRELAEWRAKGGGAFNRPTTRRRN